MVEQIDRDAAYQPFIAIYGQRVADKMLAGDMDGHHLLQAFAAHRAAERARILAAMRQPDAAMLEAVAKAIWGDEPGADEYWTAFEDHANRALAAAADHMEAGDAG